MVYFIPSRWISAADKANPQSGPSKKLEWCVESNTELSEMDKWAVAQMYPFSFPPPSSTNWTTNAVSWRGNNGQQFTFDCPPNGTISSSLWGTDTYTDDSSICTAAVHASLISTSSGGDAGGN